MLNTLNYKLEKMMPFITPASVVIGVLLAAYLQELAFLIPWIFAFMTFSGSLSSNFRSLQHAISRPLPILLTMIILHIIMPIWAWSIGSLTFTGDILTITGLILGMVIPTGITSFLWVSIYKGNIALTLSIILIDTLLSPFIVPLTLSFFVGTEVEMDVWNMMKGLIGMVVIPSILGMSLNQITNGKIKENLGPRLAPFSKISLGLVVMINGAVVAPFLSNVNVKLVNIGIVVFLIAFSGYLFAFTIGKLLKLDKETIITLTFTGGMRNISAGAVIAVSYFPPAVAVPVVLAMLFQQVLASLYGAMLTRHYLPKIRRA